MKKYLFALDFNGTYQNRIKWQEGVSQKEAHQKVWESLTDMERNNLASMECIDSYVLAEQVSGGVWKLASEELPELKPGYFGYLQSKPILMCDGNGSMSTGWYEAWDDAEEGEDPRWVETGTDGYHMANVKYWAYVNLPEEFK